MEKKIENPNGVKYSLVVFWGGGGVILSHVPFEDKWYVSYMLIV